MRGVYLIKSTLGADLETSFWRWWIDFCCLIPEGDNDFSYYKIRDKYLSSFSILSFFPFYFLTLFCDFLLFYFEPLIYFYLLLFISFYLELFNDFYLFWTSYSSFYSYRITVSTLYFSSSPSFFDGISILSSSKFRLDLNIFCELCLLLTSFSYFLGGLLFRNSLKLLFLW